MPETTITIIGNLTADPELRYTANGLPVVNLTIASTPRTFNRQNNNWEDGDPLFMRASLWRDYAVNVAASLGRGARVIAVGRLKQRRYETREGEQREVIEMDVEEIGPTLRYATAKPQRSNPAGGAPGFAPAAGGNAAGTPVAGGVPPASPPPGGAPFSPQTTSPWGEAAAPNNWNQPQSRSEWGSPGVERPAAPAEPIPHPVKAEPAAGVADLPTSAGPPAEDDDAPF